MHRSAFTHHFEPTVVAALVRALAGCAVPVQTAQSLDSDSHPLDPLTADELTRTVDLLREAGRVNDATRFSNIELREPSKARVLEWAAETQYGTLVAPGLVATNHDHFFSFRLDLDINGPDNSLSIDRLVTIDLDGPRSGWVVQSEIAAREQDAQLDYDPSSPAIWRVVNPDAEGPSGHAPGYVLRPGNSVAYSLLSREDMAQRRGGFTDHHLWVTPHAPDEFYAAGVYQNQSAGTDGLTVWTNANRPIENTDIVIWYTAGFHHVPRTEDFPIMPTAFHQFELRPFNFFDGNPALDIPTEWGSVATETVP